MCFGWGQEGVGGGSGGISIEGVLINGVYTWYMRDTHGRVGWVSSCMVGTL